MGNGLATEEAVRRLLLLMPRIVGRAKRLPMPEVLQQMDLAPRHLALLAYLQHEGALGVGALAERLEVAPTTVSLMVADLFRAGVVERTEDERDRRRRLVSLAPEYVAAVDEWLGGSAETWARVLGGLTAAQRRLVVDVLESYEAALGGP